MLDFLKRKKKAEKQPKVKRSFFRELANDILFALIAVTIIRGLFIEAYAIPTGSMENSMLIGDHLFVSKVHFGPRTPTTLIQFPLAHQKFWGTDIPSYSDIIQAPSFRLPGLRDPRVGEPVVFNYPPDTQYPLDIKTFYVKRCMATPGDVFEVRNKQVYVNGEPAENTPGMLTSYLAETPKGVHQRYLREIGITDYTDKNPFDTYATNALPNNSYNGKIGFEFHTTREKADKLAEYNFIESVEEIFHPKGSGPPVYPISTNYDGSSNFSNSINTRFDWTIDNFGPLKMPSKGMEIELTPRNIDLYGRAIQFYEHNDDVEIRGEEVFIEGEKIETYTFKQGYYFMIGDNRHNSADSRTWGLVPYDHIVGKPLFIFWSMDRTDPNTGFFQNIRFNRILDLIK
ncbi:signal peptidase I [Roseivirga sp. E12]|uniref:signal peptidase I n=1 Tax=Roseivirga sp. E12 TaxID=2819237 RepID=UPI001ABC303D|nr:signal peptidase I [Roseivirga sp. E12]MBO3698998.1 signal peptidase I [Roseivirga sp. E12]